MEPQRILDKIKEFLPAVSVSVTYRQDDENFNADLERKLISSAKASAANTAEFPREISLDNPKAAPLKIEIPPYLPAEISMFTRDVEGSYIRIYPKNKKYELEGHNHGIAQLEDFLIDSGYRPKRC